MGATKLRYVWGGTSMANKGAFNEQIAMRPIYSLPLHIPKVLQAFESFISDPYLNK